MELASDGDLSSRGESEGEAELMGRWESDVKDGAAPTVKSDLWLSNPGPDKPRVPGTECDRVAEGSLGFDELIPEEVVYQEIFKQMDVLDLLRIDLTCKRWYRLISKAIIEFNLLKTSKLLDGESKLAQVLTLLSHGMVHSPPTSPKQAVALTEPLAPHPVRSLVNVEELSLFGIADDTILSYLGSLSGLRKLNLGFTKLTSVGIENLSRLNSVTHLSLLHCGYDSTCLSKVQSLKKLRTLVELTVTKDTPLGIRMALKGLPITVPQHCIPP